MTVGYTIIALIIGVFLTAMVLVIRQGVREWIQRRRFNAWVEVEYRLRDREIALLYIDKFSTRDERLRIQMVILQVIRHQIQTNEARAKIGLFK